MDSGAALHESQLKIIRMHLKLGLGVASSHDRNKSKPTLSSLAALHKQKVYIAGAAITANGHIRVEKPVSFYHGGENDFNLPFCVL